MKINIQNYKFLIFIILFSSCSFKEIQEFVQQDLEETREAIPLIPKQKPSKNKINLTTTMDSTFIGIWSRAASGANLNHSIPTFYNYTAVKIMYSKNNLIYISSNDYYNLDTSLDLYNALKKENTEIYFDSSYKITQENTLININRENQCYIIEPDNDLLEFYIYDSTYYKEKYAGITGNKKQFHNTYKLIDWTKK